MDKAPLPATHVLLDFPIVLPPEFHLTFCIPPTDRRVLFQVKVRGARVELGEVEAQLGCVVDSLCPQATHALSLSLNSNHANKTALTCPQKDHPHHQDEIRFVPNSRRALLDRTET